MSGVQLSKMQISLGALAGAVMVLAPALWNGMSWAVELESQVAANAKQINTIIVKFEKRDDARVEDGQKTNELALEMLKKIDELINQQRGDDDGT